jgi:hypothetical protein
MFLPHVPHGSSFSAALTSPFSLRVPSRRDSKGKADRQTIEPMRSPAAAQTQPDRQTRAHEARAQTLSNQPANTPPNSNHHERMRGEREIQDSGDIGLDGASERTNARYRRIDRPAMSARSGAEWRCIRRVTLRRMSDIHSIESGERMESERQQRGEAGPRSRVATFPPRCRCISSACSASRASRRPTPPRELVRRRRRRARRRRAPSDGWSRRSSVCPAPSFTRCRTRMSPTHARPTSDRDRRPARETCTDMWTSKGSRALSQ